MTQAAHPNAPIVSVLVVNWNTEALLRRCLASLATLDEAGDLEVVVVDNGSEDGSVAMLRENFPDVSRIENEQNLGFTRATNQAYACARGEYVLMLNSDTVVDSGAIRTAWQYLRANPAVGAVGCRLRNEDDTEQSACFRFPSLFGLLMTATRLSQTFPQHRILNWDRYGGRAWTAPSKVDVVMGSFMLVRRGAVASSCLLDEGYFMYAEETDLCRRLDDAGWSVMILPQVSIVHVGEASSKTPAQQAWSDQAKKRGVLRFLYTWRGPAIAWAANLIMLVGMLPRSAGWVVMDARARRQGNRSSSERLVGQRIRMHVDFLFHPRKVLDPWNGPP